MFRSQKQRPWFEMDSSSITLFFATPCEALTTHPGVTKVGAAAHHFCLSSGALEGCIQVEILVGSGEEAEPSFPLLCLAGAGTWWQERISFPWLYRKIQCMAQ